MVRIYFSLKLKILWRQRLMNVLQRNALAEVQREYPKTHAVVEVQVLPAICFNTVKMQFRTLGHYSKSES